MAFCISLKDCRDLEQDHHVWLYDYPGWMMRTIYGNKNELPNNNDRVDHFYISTTHRKANLALMVFSRIRHFNRRCSFAEQVLSNLLPTWHRDLHDIEKSRSFLPISYRHESSWQLTRRHGCKGCCSTLSPVFAMQFVIYTCWCSQLLNTMGLTMLIASTDFKLRKIPISIFFPEHPL